MPSSLLLLASINPCSVKHRKTSHGFEWNSCRLRTSLLGWKSSCQYVTKIRPSKRHFASTETSLYAGSSTGLSGGALTSLCFTCSLWIFQDCEKQLSTA